VAPDLGLDLEVVTLDHGLRPESKAEVLSVQRLGAHLSVPVHVRQLALPQGPGLEARARETRYRALEALRLERRLSWVATAHTASDQAETLLMRLVRGTALRGAAGIRETRGAVIRPLLGWSRQETLAYLAARRQPFHEDASNGDRRFLRARVRADVLPALEEAAGYPVVLKLARFAELAADDDAFLSRWAQAACVRLRTSAGGLDAPGVRALPLPLRRRVLAHYLFESGVEVDAARIEGALLLLGGGPPAPLSGDRTLRLRKGSLWVVANAPRRTSNPRTAKQSRRGAGSL
jgi:tRNA(Ile)-lysidine synthase